MLAPTSIADTIKNNRTTPSKKLRSRAAT